MQEPTPSISALLTPALSGHRPITKADLQCLLDLVGVCEGLISRLPSDLVVKYQLVKHSIASKMIKSCSSSMKASKFTSCNKSTQATALPPDYLCDSLSKTRAILRRVVLTFTDSLPEPCQTYAESLSSIATSDELLELTAVEMTELAGHIDHITNDLQLKLKGFQESQKSNRETISHLNSKIDELKSVIDHLNQDKSENDSESTKIINDLKQQIKSMKVQHKNTIDDLQEKWKNTVQRYRVKMLNWSEAQVANTAEKYEEELRTLKKQIKRLTSSQVEDLKTEEKTVKRADSEFQTDSSISQTQSDLPIELPLLTPSSRSPQRKPLHRHQTPSIDLESESDSEAIRNSLQTLYPSSKRPCGLEATKQQLIDALRKSKEVG
ncbi:hypothetical protein P9112_008865 [Eukaryota sp. TZLM1-RC]